ncbi:uncharacterized protein LOC117647885 [Thrips palmi]|uniref:Uncharacterized protein LOC117647885 n=1 Tax=Thrips palmi TaxID=161013 RepID=A0A6P8Z6C7_THRPL|nr:uncharacterized protein LOC117647885 [Thrips palmi]
MVSMSMSSRCQKISALFASKILWTMKPTSGLSTNVVVRGSALSAQQGSTTRSKPVQGAEWKLATSVLRFLPSTCCSQMPGTHICFSITMCGFFVLLCVNHFSWIPFRTFDL